MARHPDDERQAGSGTERLGPAGKARSEAAGNGRDARLKAALKQNLARRKAQSRARAERAAREDG
jgi:hypothetical protein